MYSLMFDIERPRFIITVFLQESLHYRVNSPDYHNITITFLKIPKNYLQKRLTLCDVTKHGHAR